MRSDNHPLRMGSRRQTATMNGTESYEALRRPTSIQDTGLSTGLLAELALKTIYNAGEIRATDVSDALRLPFVGITDRILELLDREELVTIIGAEGFGPQAYRFTLSNRGIARVRQALEHNQYVGPAPVPLIRYNAMVSAQAVGEVLLDEADLRAALDGLVINQMIIDRIGPALNSGQSLFLYGPPGNGKTTIATRMARLLGRDPVYIPYAASVDSHIIKVYDDFNHTAVRSATQGTDRMDMEPGRANLDERWVLIERPTVVVGGELTLRSLDLIWDPTTKYYEAPFQMKANGGMFLIDDFGRQQMDPQSLLNRWIVPLETRVDFLSLHTGKKIQIPFEQLVVFSTNLDPADLVDAAFLRRIRHKLRVDDPSPEEFHEVYRMECQKRGIDCSKDGFVHLVREWYVKPQREFKNCHPRDILDQLMDIAKYRRLEPVATPEMIDRACSAYFADL
ncbi:MAG: AAA family ATPase [Anaerolineae bacterium]